MSSTTERRREGGQVIVLFAGAIVVLFLVAALALDLGMLFVERRDQQNAADAAALAGARYVQAAAYGTTDCDTLDLGAVPALDSPTAAAWAACKVAGRNGSGDDETVLVHIPPIHSEDWAGFDGFIEVQVASTRPSIFGGIAGRSDWSVGVMAIAANQPGITYSFGMLALNETACKAIHISGSGTVNAASSVQSNSTGEDCTGDGYGLSRTGVGVLNVTAPDAVCRSAGDIQDNGSGSMTCTPDPYSFVLPDPLRNLPAPAKPALAAAMKEVDRLTGAVVSLPDITPAIPDYCPGAAPPKEPVEATPQKCTLGQGGAQADRKWILSPGLYPGGLELKGGVTAYLLPGIYWIGGGGFQTSGGASVISVNSETDRARAVCTPGATPPCTGGGGVLIYNSQLDASPAGPISLGGGAATLALQPYDYPFGDSTIDLVIFQDRAVTLPLTLNGGDSDAEVRGIVYVPEGQVKVNGSSSSMDLDQVIADTFLIDGSGGTVNILREMGVDAEISAVGLVE